MGHPACAYIFQALKVLFHKNVIYVHRVAQKWRVLSVTKISQETLTR